MLDHFVRKRGLTLTGSPILTCTSQLLSVVCDGPPAMLKVTDDADEKHGHLLMRWWAGLSPAWQIGT
jgi:streptomycin 6-kinase